MARRRIVDPVRAEVDRLSRLVAHHAALASRRRSGLRLCACDLCGHAQRRLEALSEEHGSHR